jgi:TRAP-type transport system small permease protein
MSDFERFLRLLSRLFNYVALAALTAMLILVTLDIVGAKALGKPVPGAMDLTSLIAVFIIGFSTSQTYIYGRHIKVDFVTVRLPSRLRRAVRCLSVFLCIGFFSLATWRIGVLAAEMCHTGEKSMTVKIPLYPFAWALTLALAPMIPILILQLYHLFKGVDE